MAAKKKVSANSVSELDGLGIYQKDYYVPKASGTFTDVLLAYGFAAVVYEVLRQAKGPTGRVSLRLEDIGSCYQVVLSEPLSREWVEKCHYFSIVKGIRTPTAKTGDMPESELEDFEGTWQQIRDYLTALQEVDARPAETEAEMVAADLTTLDPRHWITVFIGTRQMQALGTYNDATRQWWETREHFATNLKTLLALYAKPDSDTEAIIRTWKTAVPVKLKAELTASQMLNPHQGKGQNRPKANNLAMGNLRSFWLFEYLKAAGFWWCVAPRRVRDGNDRKTYVLAPVSLTLAVHQTVFEKFSDRLWASTAVKMDCLASLLYTETLLEHSEAGQYDELAALLGDKSVGDIVTGFHVAQYKLLSRNAYTMMNLGLLGLPRWISLVKSREEVKQLRNVLEEHCRILDTIDEARSDGYGLLLRYRDFLSSNRWNDFFDFTGTFAGYLIRDLDEARRQNRRPRVRSFTTSNLEVMIMQGNKPLLSIVRTPGFRNIARAIRMSTVTLQYLAREQGRGKLPYEIRYGLSQELLRKAIRSDEFVAAVSAFSQVYNAENAKIAEKKEDVWRREAITDQDLDDLVRLVDEYGASTIAHLLVAYGYAREAKEEV